MKVSLNVKLTSWGLNSYLGAYRFKRQPQFMHYRYKKEHENKIGNNSTETVNVPTPKIDLSLLCAWLRQLIVGRVSPPAPVGVSCRERWVAG